MPIVVSQSKKKKGAYGGVVGQIVTNEFYGAVMEKGSKFEPPPRPGDRTLRANGTITTTSDEVAPVHYPSDSEALRVGATSARRRSSVGKFFHAFFSPLDFLRAVPQVWDGFQTNIKLMVIAEALVLVFALISQSSAACLGRAFFPLRAIAIVYTDIFRGTPLILVLFIVGLGVPALNIAGISDRSLFFYGIVSLTLVYTAYVTEVYRAGIESVHPSQRMAARSLGLTYSQALRFVILPAGDQACDPAAPERLHRSTEGHRTHHGPRAHRGCGAGRLLLLGLLQLRGLHCRGRVLHHPHDPARPLYRPPRQGAGAARTGPSGVTGGNSHFVSLEKVTKSFGDLEVLHGIDLTVDLHQVVCLIGASGSGKSTLLRCVNLLEQVDSGTIVVDGQIVTGTKVDVNALRRKIGIVFQAYNLFPHMTVMENVTLAPMQALKLSKAEAHARASELLALIGLEDKADEYPDRLSGGQQQRVAIARALGMNPSLMLLDEITSALDPQLVGDVLALVRTLANEGMTMIIATHEMSFARDLADKVCFLDEGVILEEGPPAQIFSSPREARTQEFLQRVIESGRL